MAVTLVVNDLKEPEGELVAAQFAEGNIDTLLTGWLAQATAEIQAAAGIDVDDHNAAAAAWIYHRAYLHLANTMAMLPSSESYPGGVSRGYDDRNIAHWRKQAEQKLAEFHSYNAHKPLTDRPVSMAVQNRVTW